MTLEEQVVSVLINATPAGAKVFPTKATQGTLAPYITINRISTVPSLGVNVRLTLDRVRLQIDVWAKSRSQAALISTAVRGIMEAISTDVTVKPFMTEQEDGYDDDLDLYVRSSDFICWERVPR